MFKEFITSWIRNPKVQMMVVLCLILDYYRTHSVLMSLCLITLFCLNYLGFCYLLMARIRPKPRAKLQRVSDQYRPRPILLTYSKKGLKFKKE